MRCTFCPETATKLLRYAERRPHGREERITYLCPEHGAEAQKTARACGVPDAIEDLPEETSS